MENGACPEKNGGFSKKNQMTLKTTQIIRAVRGEAVFQKTKAD